MVGRGKWQAQGKGLEPGGKGNGMVRVPGMRGEG